MPKKAKAQPVVEVEIELESECPPPPSTKKFSKKIIDKNVLKVSGKKCNDLTACESDEDEIIPVKKTVGKKVVEAPKSPSVTCKAVNPWLAFIAKYRAKHPNLSYKECLVKAGAVYKKK